MTVKLFDILSGLDTEIGRTIKSCGLLALWSRVVDERVRRHTEPIKIRNKVLYVSASSPTWAQELSFFRLEIVEKFNQAAGECVVKDIKFKAGGLHEH